MQAKVKKTQISLLKFLLDTGQGPTAHKLGGDILKAHGCDPDKYLINLDTGFIMEKLATNG